MITQGIKKRKFALFCILKFLVVSFHAARYWEGMTNRTEKRQNDAKDNKLKSALRDNLKKRKNQARKLGERDGQETGFSVKLRARDIPKAGKKPSNPAKDEKQDRK